MNETTKKVLLIVLVVVALAAAIWQGKNAVMGEPEVKHEIGHGTPGHGMKAAENAEEQKAAQGSSTGAKGDPLAGPG